MAFNDSSHWYDKTGKACHQVANKSRGGMRPVKITDARTLGLFPSVTTILSVLDKPALADWKHRQITKACYDHSAADKSLPEFDEYHATMVRQAFQSVTDAADLGTDIHKALEHHFQGKPFNPDLAVYVEAVDKWMQEEGVTLQEQELRLVSASHGFAGTTDAVMRSKRGCGILDFKSRKTKPGYPATPWETQPMQIAAYHVAHFCLMPEAGHVGCNLFISTTEPGRVDACWYDHEQLRREWQAFSAVMTIWRHLKGYDPRDLTGPGVVPELPAEAIS